MNKTLYIRTDSNSTLGVGHVMRCSTIAEEWQRRGGMVCFLVADRASADVVEERGYPVHILSTAVWNDLERELQELQDFLTAEKVELLLVDSYYITRRYMKTLYGISRLIYLGKFHDAAFPAHLVIDYTIQVMENAQAYRHYDAIGARQLLGCDYFPLRREFVEEEEIREPVAQNADFALFHIFITTGGSDPFHVALELSRRLAGQTGVCLHVVVGGFNRDQRELERLSQQCDNLCIYQNVRRISSLMRRCDLAVSAGGITLYELCACGIPTVTYTFADNQLPAVEVFQKRNIVLSVGDIRDRHPAQWTDQIGICLSRLMQREDERVAMAERMIRLVDGQGAGRIVESLLSLSEM